MTMNLRCDDKFVQDESWYFAAERYNDFMHRYKDLHILFLELGVGSNTPTIIKYSFWNMVHKLKNAVYVCLNYGEAYAPVEIKEKSICINSDIGEILDQLK